MSQYLEWLVQEEVRVKQQLEGATFEYLCSLNEQVQLAYPIGDYRATHRYASNKKRAYSWQARCIADLAKGIQKRKEAWLETFRRLAEQTNCDEAVIKTDSIYFAEDKINASLFVATPHTPY